MVGGWTQSVRCLGPGAPLAIGSVNDAPRQAWVAQVQRLTEQTRAKGVMDRPFDKEFYDAPTLSARLRQLNSAVDAVVQYERDLRNWMQPDGYSQIQQMVQSVVAEMRDSPIVAKQSQAAWLSRVTAELSNGLR